MSISGFSFIRNGNKLNYPFIQSIESVLPICDEFIIAVGNSDDGTKEEIQKINSSKIKIIDTVWDDTLRVGGKILAHQTNIAFDYIKSDWGFYIQGDEVIHERDYEKVLKAATKYQSNSKVEGFLFSYYHFYGNYNYIRDRYNKRAYCNEIRMIRNDSLIRSYRDAQGFRRFTSNDAYIQNEDGKKLNVIKINADIYHYGMVRNPEQELARQIDFNKLWHSDDWVQKNIGDKVSFEYNSTELLESFKDSHPSIMKDRILKNNWDFKYDPKKVKEPLRYKIQNRIGKLCGYRFFDYKNYKIIGSDNF